MNKNKITEKSGPADFDSTQLRIRSLTLNAALIIGMLMTLYFGVSDALHNRIFARKYQGF